jgi:hypothetical protein
MWTNFVLGFHIPNKKKYPYQYVSRNIPIIAERILFRQHQHFNSNLWAGIVGDSSVGLRVLLQWLAGFCSRDCLLNSLPKLPLAVRARVIMHDDAPTQLKQQQTNSMV